MRIISPGILLCSLFFSLIMLHPLPVAAEGDSGLNHPSRFGAGLTIGHSYDPRPPFDFYELTGFLQYDYDQLWPHHAPDPLFFKVEGSVGLASFHGDEKLLTSVNILAQYYLPKAGTEHFQPYVEAGIGVIYTDFQVDGQGLRINFNPQAGIGCDLLASAGNIWFTNLRIHHLSNGELHKENRGINSVLIQIGKYFTY